LSYPFLPLLRTLYQKMGHTYKHGLFISYNVVLFTR